MTGLLGGFDVALEIGHPVVQSAMADGLRLGSQQIRLGGDLQYSVPVSTPVGSRLAELQGVVDKIDLDIGSPRGDKSVTLTIGLREVSVRVLGWVACPLKLDIEITVPVDLGDGPLHCITLRFPSAVAKLLLTQDALDKLRRSLPNVDVSPFTDQAASVLESQVTTLPPMSIPSIAFQLRAGADGGIEPLVFSRADILCVWDEARDRQVLMLLAMLIHKREHWVNSTLKQTALSAARTVALSFSAEAATRFLICPEIARQLGGTPPGTCGGRDSVKFKGLDVVAAWVLFGAGRIILATAVKQDGFCYTASAQVVTLLTPRVNDMGKVIVDTIHEKPKTRLDVHAGCYVAAFVLAPTIGIVLATVDSLADGIGVSMPAAFSFVVSSLVDVEWNSVTVTHEGITFGATPPIRAISGVHAYAGLQVSNRLLSMEVESRGVDDLSHFCDDLHVSWEERRQSIQFDISVEAIGYGRPLDVTWSLVHGGGTETLPKTGQGSVELTVEAVYDTAHGEERKIQPALMQFEVLSRSALRLCNRASDGNYGVLVKAAIVNCARSLDTTLHYLLTCDGHVLWSAANFGTFKQCFGELLESLEIAAEPFPPLPQESLDWPWGPMEIDEIQLKLAASPSQEAQSALMYLQHATGGSRRSKIFGGATGEPRDFEIPEFVRRQLPF